MRFWCLTLLLLCGLATAALAVGDSYTVPDSLIIVDRYSVDPELATVTAAAYEANLVSQSPGPSTVTLLANQLLNCTVVTDNVGTNDWLSAAGTGYVELRSTDSLGTVAQPSALASDWISSSSVRAVSGTVLAQFGSANAANSCTMAWTTVGDDSLTGTASQFDLRFGTSPITLGGWDTFTRYATPAPQAPGVQVGVLMTDLTPSTSYYFNVRTGDEVPNWSALSNMAQYTTASVRTTFSFALRAPATSGRYVLFLRPYAQGTGYFGPVVKMVVQVNSVEPMIAHYGLILRDPASGSWWGRVTNRNTFVPMNGPNSTPDLLLSGWAVNRDSTVYAPYRGDLNGDGFDDLIVRRNDGTWYWARNNQNGTYTPFDPPLLTGYGANAAASQWTFWFTNLDADASDELLTYDPSTGDWSVHQFNLATNTLGNRSVWLTWGAGVGVYQPLVGDWDGDHLRDICLRKWSTGQHYVRLSTGAGFTMPNPELWTTWGPVPSADLLLPLVGDWDGDGKDDLALFNPNTASGRWYTRLSNGSAFVFPPGSNNPADTWASWTAPGVIPFVGDMDENGQTDIGLRSPSRGDHWVRLSTGLAFTLGTNDNWSPSWGVGTQYQFLTGRFGGLLGGGSPTFSAPTTDAPLDRLPRPLSLSCAPNPFRGYGTIRLTLPVGEHGQIELFDLGGRRVDGVRNQWFEAGVMTFTWTGQLESGRALASGMYFLRYSSTHRRVTTRVVVSR